MIDLKVGSYFIEKKNIGLFHFSGPDHLRYLHNRLTQDIKGILPGSGARALVLTPNGRIQGDLIVLRSESAIEIVSGELQTQEEISELQRAILQFKVADQLECKTKDFKVSQLSLFGNGLPALGMMLGIEVSEKPRFAHFDKEFDGANLKIVVNRFFEQLSIDIIGNSEAIEQLKLMGSMFGLQELSVEQKDYLRVLSKTWQFGVDVDDKTVGAEVSLDELVSFKKGCYPGQEVIEMSISRGRPNRSLEVLSSDSEVRVGQEIKVDEKVVGTVTSSVYSTDLLESYFLSRIKTDSLSSPSFQIGNNSSRIMTDEERKAKFA